MQRQLFFYMPYRKASQLSPIEQKAAHKLYLFQNQRLVKLRKLYTQDQCPLLHSASPLSLLGGDNIQGYIGGIKKLAEDAHAPLQGHGTKWVLVSKAVRLEPTQPHTHAVQLAHIQNIRIQYKTRNSLSVQNAVVDTKLLRYLLCLRGEGLLTTAPESAFSLSMLSKIARYALKLPHYAHLDTTLDLGLRLMGFTLTKGRLNRMVLGAKLHLDPNIL